LRDAVSETPDLQPGERVGRFVARARLVLDGAQARCTAAKRGPAKRKLTRVGRHLNKVLRALRPSLSRQPAADSLSATTALLRGDTRTLAHGLVCP
jgi:hypothetical protein